MAARHLVVDPSAARARNQAQHHGTVADAGNMPSWAAQSQRFVDSMVVAAFGVELSRVLLAESVESEEVRLPLIEAEQALEQQDAVGALDAALSGFDIAREAWRGQRSETIGQLRLQYSGLNTLSGVETDPTNLSLRRFEDLSEVQPFAPDIGEYHWLLGRRDEAKEIPPTLDASRRAFQFILAWVLRWEAFAARYEPRRYLPPAPAYEPPVTGSDHPVVLDTSVETQHHIGNWLDPPTLENARYLVKLTLADLPTAERELWAEQVSDVLSELVAERGFEHVGAANVSADGIVRFHGVSAEVGGDEIEKWVETALGEGDRRYREKLAERQMQDAQLPEAIRRLESALADARTDDLVAGVLSDMHEDGAVRIGVQLHRDEDPMLGHLLDGVVQSARSAAVGLDYFHTTLWFVPDFDPREAAAIIKTVAANYRDQAADRLQGAAAVEERRHALELEVRKDALDTQP